jgi:hypothetical protein
MNPDPAQDAIKRMTRRSFAIGGVASLLALGGWQWLRSAGEEAAIPWPFRRVLDFNARLAQGLFKSTRLSPTFSVDQAREPRVNGQIGFDQPLNPARWKLRVETATQKAAREFSLAQIKELPRVEMVTELKCIEGWSEVVQWVGARFVDFLTEYKLGTRSGAVLDPERQSPDLFKHVQFETPGGGYYVGLDMASALHPQTLLCYEMNGESLTPDHGAPLRLVVPVKYGIKNIKRIGTIRFLDRRPADYWAERGYDWYAGL